MKLRKTIVLLLAACLMFPLPAAADSDPDVTITIGEATGEPGDTVSVPVSIGEPAEPVYAFGLYLSYPDDRLEVAGIENGLAEIANEDWNAEDGWIGIAWVDETLASPVAGEGVLFTIKFTIRANAPAGTAEIGLHADPGNTSFAGIDGQPLDVAVEEGSVLIELPPPAEDNAPVTDKTGTSSNAPLNIPVRIGGNGTDILTIFLHRTVAPDGTYRDRVEIGQQDTERVADQLRQSGDSYAVLYVPSDWKSVSELIVVLPRNAANVLAQAGIGLELNLQEARLLIPAGSLQNANEDIQLRLAPAHEIPEYDGIVVSRPLSVETNLQGKEFLLILPLVGREFSIDAMTGLGVHAGFKDGTAQRLVGEIVSYDDNGSYGLLVTADQSGLFAVVIRAPYLAGPYMNGYPDDTFRPDQNVTRAELATALLRTILSTYSLPSATAEGFEDVEESDWAFEAIARIAAAGLMGGYGDGSFRPDQDVTRAELAVVIARIVSVPPGAAPSFTDIDGHWAQGSIVWVAQAGIFRGYGDGSFRPEGKLTRAELVVVLNRLLGIPAASGQAPQWSDVSDSHWAYDAIQSATAESQS
jgi:hypothetical protein